jgi:cysteine desulfurase
MIYLDHSATTPMCEAAKEAIVKHLDTFGNPSSSYEFGRESRVLIENAREIIAKCINAEPNEIYFTSGGSEANTWALHNKKHLSSSMEHHSISPYFRVSPEVDGILNTEFVKSILNNHTYKWGQPIDVLSCMYVNNELGTIQPVNELARVAHDNNAMFHTDAVQAVGHVPVDVKDIDCDMLSASGHKFGAPKGIGFLYVKNGVRISPLIHGGKQEQGKRGGTENVLGIVSMAAALDDATQHMEEHNQHIKNLRDKMLSQLLQIDGSHLNGSLEKRTASNINIRFDGVHGTRLVTLCDLYDVCISSGSACNEGAQEPSHVLQAIGLTYEEALSSVRITLGHENTEEEIDIATDVITKLVERIRTDGM